MMNHAPSTPLAGLAELFERELADVTFPGVDRDLVAAALQEEAQAESRVADAEAACAEAHRDRDATRASTQAFMERALAYLRVYAADHAELLAKLDALSPKPRAAKRGRRRKAPVTAVTAEPKASEVKVARAS
ncbi:MAG: hypothetical protein KC731_03355 [Myxococcales bacterium]|nr:hypothetical protein [Myxococcales bacterium]